MTAALGSLFSTLQKLPASCREPESAGTGWSSFIVPSDLSGFYSKKNIPIPQIRNNSECHTSYSEYLNIINRDIRYVNEKLNFGMIKMYTF